MKNVFIVFERIFQGSYFMYCTSASLDVKPILDKVWRGDQKRRSPIKKKKNCDP